MGLTSFTSIYDRDIILVDNSSDWSWNATVDLCSLSFLPCFLTIRGTIWASDSVNTIYRRGKYSKCRLNQNSIIQQMF